MISIEGHLRGNIDYLSDLALATKAVDIDDAEVVEAQAALLHFVVRMRAQKVRRDGQQEGGVSWVEIPLEHEDLWAELDRLAEATATLQAPDGGTGVLAYTINGIRTEGATDAFLLDIIQREPSAPDLRMLCNPVEASMFVARGWIPIDGGITTRGRPRRTILRTGVLSGGHEEAEIVVRMKFDVLHDTGCPTMKRWPLMPSPSEPSP